MSCDYEPELSEDEWEGIPFGTIDIEFEEGELEPRPKYEPVDWDMMR